jgi:hypothetical protein
MISNQTIATVFSAIVVTSASSGQVSAQYNYNGRVYQGPVRIVPQPNYVPTMRTTTPYYVPRPQFNVPRFNPPQFAPGKWISDKVNRDARNGVDVGYPKVGPFKSPNQNIGELGKWYPKAIYGTGINAGRAGDGVLEQYRRRWRGENPWGW